MPKIYHSEIFGSRESKYNWLNKHSIKNVKWKKVTPYPSFYLFIPTDNKLANHYYSFDSIVEIFPVNSVGIVTARDKFVIDFDKKKLERRITDFRSPRIDDELIRRTYDLKENQSWKIKDQREKLKKDFDWKDSITKILYRPFDERWIFYHDELIERTRKEVMKNMMMENIGLIARRQMLPNKPMNYFFISDKIIADGVIRSDNRGGESLFPLYIYSEQEEKRRRAPIQMAMFEPEIKYQAKKPNIKQELFKELKKKFKRQISPDKIFYYIYAVLYSNTYRKKYEEFLKIDFPRIPFTKDYKLFIEIGKLGKQLAGLHLLNSKELDNPAKGGTKFPVEGSNKVEKLKYTNVETGHPVRSGQVASSLQTGKVFINKNQYFDSVKEEVWNYQIGGYQVCEKWLKDRKGRTLSLDEIRIYDKIVISLSKTIELQKKIDNLYERLESTVSR